MQDVHDMSVKVSLSLVQARARSLRGRPQGRVYGIGYTR